PPPLHSLPTRRSSDLPLAPPQLPGRDAVRHPQYLVFRQRWPAPDSIPAQQQLQGGERIHAAAQQVTGKAGQGDVTLAFGNPYGRDRKSTRLNSSHVKN